jgi:hypothetical protein
MTQVRRVAQSGQKVVVDIPSHPELGSVSTYARFSGPQFARGFQAFPPGTAAAMAVEDGEKAEVLDRFLFQNREVTITRSRPEEILVAWHGPFHELVTVFAPVSPGRAQVLDILRRFVLEDSAEGLAVKPTASSGIDNANEGLFFTVPGFVVMSVPNPANALALVPQNKGTKTAHGEIWRASRGFEGAPQVAEARSAKDVRFILGTPGGAAEIYFEPTSPADDSQLLDWLDQVNVSWT